MGKAHCSWCYKAGHKKTTCEDYKNKLYSWVEKNGVDYLSAEERRHFKNFKAKESGKRTTSARKCSFCGESGHNKKTCSSLQTTKAMYGAINDGFRLTLEEGLKGLHPGALIGGGEYHYRNGVEVKVNSWTGMVSHVDYRNINLGFLLAKSTPNITNKIRGQGNRIVKAILMSSTKGTSNSWSDGFEKSCLGQELKTIRMSWDSMYHNAFKGDGDYGVHDVKVGDGKDPSRFLSAHKRRKSQAWVAMFDYWRALTSESNGYNSKTKSISDYEIISECAGEGGTLVSRDCSEGWDWFLCAAEQKAKDDRYRDDPVIEYAMKILFEAAYFIPKKHRQVVSNTLNKAATEYENKVLTKGDGVRLDRYDVSQKTDYVTSICDQVRSEAKNV